MTGTRNDELPEELHQLLLFPGITPQHVDRIYNDLGIDTLAKLEAAIKKQLLRALPGFGAKVELGIKKNLKLVKEIPERLPIAFVYPIAIDLLSLIRNYSEVSRAEIAGCLRRFTETMEHLEIVIATEEPRLVAKQLLELPHLQRVTSHTEEQLVIVLQYLWPLEVVLTLVPSASFAFSWLYRTGSKQHLQQLEQLAKEQELELQWLGIRDPKSNEILQFNSEIQIYERLTLPYIPSELREGREEIARIQANKGSPRLIELGDLQGDLHMHTNWSDGGNRIEEMARAAIARGYRYIAITDHSRSLKIAGGLSIERLLKQREEIKIIERKLQKEFGEFSILCGIEMDILADGRLDYPNELLQEMDLVIGSIHTAFDQDEYRITKRVMDAILNLHIDFIAHPTGRLIGRREPYPVNMEILFTAAKETGTALELNSNPERLDLKAEYIQEAIEKYGILITINTDAHSIEELKNIELGIGTARRGWVQPEHVINTWSLDRLKQYLSRND